MKKLFSISSLLIAGLIVFSACSDDDSATPEVQPSESVVEIASGNDDFSTLVTALSEANLVNALSGDGPFTVFAPTNDAFAALLSETGLTAEQLLASDLLDDVLLYHVVEGKILSTDLTNGDVETLGGQTISINIDNGVVINGSSSVTTADIEATNGVIHIIDAVLVPEDLNLNPSIVDIAVSNDDFSTLVTALSTAELVEALSADGPFTVFAPTNDAFAQLLTDNALTVEELLASDLLDDVLLYHVVEGRILSTDLTNGDVTTLGGSTLTINIDNGVTINGSSTVTTADIEGSNGVIHIIDEVLVPEDVLLNPTIVDIAVSNDDFSILVQALTTAGLVEALNGEGPFTVFAPTDAAFAALLEELDVTAEQLLAREDLADILLYHVVSGAVFSTDLSNGEVPTLLTDSSVTISIDNGVSINDRSTVTTADISARNGVIHIIDKVLLPQ